MPTIGVYVAVASLLYTLAMAADAFQAFCLKRLWFPCKFFALNATSLTVLAVAMKLPVDISEPMPGDSDQLSKLASTVFMCVVICNFMPSIGTMSNKEILSNIVALNILGPNYHQSEQELGKDFEFLRYVLLLEGEEEMPERIFNISGTANRLADTGRKRLPKHLMKVLRKSSSFSGVADIYCDQFLALHSVKPSNCWNISVVTLASIAVALPKVRNQMAHQLMSVHERLTYASFVEETVFPEDKFTNIRNAVHIELEFHRKWLDEDLQKLTLEGKTSRATLEMLTGIASKKVIDFKQTTDGRMLNNPLNWPVRIIAANSMYKIGKAILLLLHSGGHNDLVDEKLFERLSITIADILSACFTNLPRAITMVCNSGAIEERERSVCRAALLVGKTEDILKIIQHHELPNINADQSAYIDQWKLVLQ
ncbi:hypothetical protein K7X08_013115 [Anisodus acutangulus]|uniref:Uncharacterized protein n=1 Tax=Anisodus acutangulus TaxID=402998 RepID=A0A9Q1RE58_9SOLA|nr:hypothetical protein K7X08_013115 [Anisodus acutangulus]